MRKKKYNADLVVVLGNLMSSKGEINKETALRADAAFHIYINSQAQNIITCGWAYRKDTRISIADATRQYLVSKFDVYGELIYAQDKSRDTVGDAYFTRVLYADTMACKSIIVVTSTYNMNRAREIFNFIFYGSAEVHVVGVGPLKPEKLDLEKNSLNVFKKMFFGVKPGNIKEIYNCMRQKHPYYNGTIYEKI